MKIAKTNVLKSYEKMSTKDLILSSMTEGVIVLDEKSKIVIINDSAKSYLDLKNKSYSGKRIKDIVKIPKFVSFVKKLLKHDKVLIQPYSKLYISSFFIFYNYCLEFVFDKRYHSFIF